MPTQTESRIDLIRQIARRLHERHSLHILLTMESHASARRKKNDLAKQCHSIYPDIFPSTKDAKRAIETAIVDGLILAPTNGIMYRATHAGRELLSVHRGFPSVNIDWPNSRIGRERRERWRNI